MPISNEDFQVPDEQLIRKALAVIGSKWRLYIILSLDERTLRYSELGALLPQISHKVLTSELKTLLKLGVMQRKMYAQVPLRVDYSLAKRGRLALPTLRQLLEVGRLFN
ncbi:winged helix-turn-helix transcriptional regulator [Larkinella soli]|uniref:winged helix-turn-helix transcriptional regulator n=1 Tax=Larkinella soli TaxID=1770527 RepID=UPI000FFB5114|nr:helix-turn-helix domain-containing protein [Larkinella soli]